MIVRLLKMVVRQNCSQSLTLACQRALSRTSPMFPKGLENADGPQFDHQLDAVLSASSSPKKELMRPTPFPSWVEQFVRQVLGAKTRFSYFVLQSISASRSGRTDSTATALFPIPYPHGDVF